MLTSLHGDRLGDWIAAAQQAGLPGITSFANGLTSDLDAVMPPGRARSTQLRTGG
ncbi:hypothetical protein ACFQS1_12705 [Paractinoplanes rhizophilus]|uniref:Uncharacterized protein n=1 Tax=Paractinoplanes rhizophilus TaxID=1416877 RepID=A0ABW2HNV2_9ACTN